MSRAVFGNSVLGTCKIMQISRVKIKKNFRLPTSKNREIGRILCRFFLASIRLPIFRFGIWLPITPLTVEVKMHIINYSEKCFRWQYQVLLVLPFIGAPTATRGSFADTTCRCNVVNTWHAMASYWSGLCKNGTRGVRRRLLAKVVANTKAISGQFL